MRNGKIMLILILFLICLSAQAWADETIKIDGTTNVEDAWIGADVDADRNYGGDWRLWTVYGVDLFLVRVKNLATLLPVNALITACVCSLYCSINEDNAAISAYRVFKPWIEGDQTGQTCTGTNVTWNNWQCSSSAWGTAGVGCANDDGVDNSQNGTCDATGRDRKATAEDTENVTAVGWYAWNISTDLAQGWYDGTVGERGIVFINDEGVGNNLFYSTEYTTDSSLCPFWTFTYTVEEEVVMRVKDDWRFRTSFFDWRFQDAEEEKEFRLVKIVDKCALLKVVDSLELVKIVGLRD